MLLVALVAVFRSAGCEIVKVLREAGVNLLLVQICHAPAAPDLDRTLGAAVAAALCRASAPALRRRRRPEVPLAPHRRGARRGRRTGGSPERRARFGAALSSLLAETDGTTLFGDVGIPSDSNTGVRACSTAGFVIAPRARVHKVIPN